jgi:hypothetical protein
MDVEREKLLRGLGTLSLSEHLQQMSKLQVLQPYISVPMGVSPAPQESHEKLGFGVLNFFRGCLAGQQSPRGCFIINFTISRGKLDLSQLESTSLEVFGTITSSSLNLAKFSLSALSISSLGRSNSKPPSVVDLLDVVTAVKPRCKTGGGGIPRGVRVGDLFKDSSGSPMTHLFCACGDRTLYK